MKSFGSGTLPFNFSCARALIGVMTSHTRWPSMVVAVCGP